MRFLTSSVAVVNSMCWEKFEWAPAVTSAGAEDRFVKPSAPADEATARDAAVAAMAVVSAILVLLCFMVPPPFCRWLFR